ncbi:hypothetical protein Tco_0532459 [Tanacetum coccineum]
MRMRLIMTELAYLDSDESDDDEPAEMIEDQKLIHHLSGSPTPSSDPVVASLTHSHTPTGDSDSILEETNTLLPHHDSTSPEVNGDMFDPEGDILFLKGLLNNEILSDLPPLELNNDPEGDISFLENLLKDEPLEANKVSEKPLDSLDCISNTFNMTITDPLFDLDSEFTLNSDNPIFGIHNEESDESETETIMDKDSLRSDLTPPEESSELSDIATLLSSPFGNEDKVFNPGILILGGTRIFHDKSKDKDLKVNSSIEALLTLMENNFLSHSSYRSSNHELLFFLESTVIEALLSFSSKNEDKVFNPEIPTDESKIHIEVLLVLCENRLPIPDGSLPLSREKDHMT